MTSTVVAGPAEARHRPERVRVFLDCQAPCDADHVRQEISFVEYVRDRVDSDVHVLITREPVDAGAWMSAPNRRR